MSINVEGATISDLPGLARGGVDFNDKITSLVNNSRFTMCLYPDADFRGRPFTVIPNDRIAKLTESRNDQFSSVRPCPGSRPA